MMIYEHIAKNIIDLKNADLALRDELIQRGELGEGYNEEMRALHNKSARVLNEIIDSIGYPTITKVGKEGDEAAWLVIQHAIEQPEFMKKCAQLLQIAVQENEADPKSLAYLTDRIAVFEGKPQSYGTQFDWDENGNLSANAFDDLIEVNKRRKALGLNTIEEQTELMRKNASNENHYAPKKFEERKREIELWKKKVGWIK